MPKYEYKNALTFIIRSEPPVANHSLLGSTSTALTHPVCPEITRYNFQGACHLGLRSKLALEGSNERTPVSCDLFIGDKVKLAVSEVMANGESIK